MKIWSNIVFFITGVLNAQTICEFTIISAYDKIPVQNALIINTQLGNFEYSNNVGNAYIKYIYEADIIKISIPSYFDKTITIDEIKENNNVVSLYPKSVHIEEITINSKLGKNKKSFFRPKFRKKYAVGFHCSGSIVSLYKHRDKNNKKLSSVSFYSENKSNHKNVQIRPLIFRIDNGKWEQVLETPKTAFVNSDIEEINFLFENTSFEFETGKEYLIGFQMIDPSKKHNINIMSIQSSKKTKTFFCSPDSEWAGVPDERFSIYYEIYFKE